MSENTPPEYLTDESFLKTLKDTPSEQAKQNLVVLATLTQAQTESTEALNKQKERFNNELKKHPEYQKLRLKVNLLHKPRSAPSPEEVQRLSKYAQQAIDAGANTDTIVHAMNFGHHEGRERSSRNWFQNLIFDSKSMIRALIRKL